MLSKKLNYSIKKTDIQIYIRKRLELLDQHYCSEAHLQLWKSFLHIGLEYQQWPVSYFVRSCFVIFLACLLKGSSLCNDKNK